MRGKGKMAVQVNRETRITPAYAGKRWQRLPPRSEQQDHPRLCGEKLLGLYQQLEDDRITPAYAGKRISGNGLIPVPRDHPRLCGEKLKRQIESKQLKGSPPPMRGKEATCGITRLLVGITPAYAGKRLPVTARCRSRGDHPRLCGEKSLAVYYSVSVVGSPPPMRGKGHFCTANPINPRITPAYAGKRQKPSISWS